MTKKIDMHNVYRFILLIISSTFLIIQSGCSNKLNQDYEHALMLEFNKLSQTHFIGCKYDNKNLSISYIDSVLFSSLHIETELQYYLLKDIIDTNQIDRVKFIINYPNRPEFPSRVTTISTKELIKNIEPRYVKNPRYLELSNNLFQEYNSRERTIPILCNCYGYRLEKKPKEDVVYDENIFQLLYACTLEINRGEYDIALIMLDKIHKDVTKFRKNSDFYSNRVLELKKILKANSDFEDQKRTPYNTLP